MRRNILPSANVDLARFVQDHFLSLVIVDRNSAVIHGKTNIAVLDGFMPVEMAVELIINVFGDRANVLAAAVLEEVRRQRLAEKAQNKVST